jgi:hypothetical protein
MDNASLGQCIFVDRAILHNHQKVFAGVFDELDIFQRIAVDQQQIGERAFFDDTKPDGIRAQMGPTTKADLSIHPLLPCGVFDTAPIRDWPLSVKRTRTHPLLD